jgi:hypothetical protein
MILATIFFNISKGVYIDIGANDPYIASNTQYFYQKGWHGINIDALPSRMNLFKKIRLEKILDSLNLKIIDFMSFDLEGMDLNVLKSKNWTKYRPKIVLTEYFSQNL